MLPGFSIKKENSFHACIKLKELQNDLKSKDIKVLDYISPSCLEECHIEIKQLCIEHGYAIEDSDCITHRSQVISKLSQEEIKKLLDDPSAIIRECALKNVKSSIDLIDFLKSEDFSVRLICIRKLTERKFLRSLNKENLTKIFNELCFLINDINVNVRIGISKVLMKFSRVDTKEIKKNLCKKDLNENAMPAAFVHGFEDENENVRLNMIESICVLTVDNEMANESFDFLVDLLNDDVSIVKEKASFWMFKLVQAFKINVKKEMVDLIFCNFCEKNEEIKNNLYEIIGNLIFHDQVARFVYEKILSLCIKNKDLHKVYECFRKFVSKNILFFYENINEFKREKNLYGIVINEILEQGFEVEMNTENNKMVFNEKLRLFLTNKNKKLKKNEEYDMKYYILDFLENNYTNPYKKYRRLFRKKLIKNKNDLLYVELFKSFEKRTFKNKINYFERLKIFYNLDQNLLINDLEKLKEICKNKQNKGKIEIKCEKTFIKRFNLPVKFKIECLYDKNFENAFLQIKYDKEKINMTIDNKILFYLYDLSNEFSIDVFVKYNRKKIKLLRTIKIYKNEKN